MNEGELELADLIGRKVLGVQMTPEKEEVRFITDIGNLDYYCYADCCSESWVNHVSDVSSLVDATVVNVEECNFYALLGVEPEPTKQESDTVLFHRVYTDKGVCVIEFRNSSNGYYGGSFERNTDREPEDLANITEDF